MILDLFRKHNEFYNIWGYDIKDIVKRALDAEENYNFLFVGPPASAKILFLLSILDIRKYGVYFDGSNTTNRIRDVLEEKTINMYRRTRQDASNIPESAFEFHRFRKGQGRPAEEAIRF